MARPRAVKPILRPGKRTYTATFSNARGKRVNRSLGTTDLETANAICAGLVLLGATAPKTIADAPVTAPAPAIRLYFDEPTLTVSEITTIPAAEPAALGAVQEWGHLPEADRIRVIDLVIDRHRLNADNQALRMDLALMTRRFKDAKAALDNLRSSALAEAVRAGQRARPIGESVAAFEQHMQATTSPGNAADAVRAVSRLVSTLPEDVQTPYDIRAEHLTRHLDAWTAAGQAHHQYARRDAEHRRIGRFVNWCARQWDYPSQMRKVPGVPATLRDRERPDIHWHTVEEVEAAIAALPVGEPRSYWPAVVATLAYAGLQLQELIWLRRADLDDVRDPWTLWVTTVVDRQVKEARHAVKSAARRRAIRVHPRLLRPRLAAYIAESPDLDEILYPNSAPRQRNTPGNVTRWRRDSLGKALLGNPGGVNRRPTPPRLPPGMNARSLRRTFGSLMIRSGRSTAEVAAAMGNTENVVRAHYARILGREVEIDF